MADWQHFLTSQYSVEQLLARGFALAVGTLIQAASGFGFSIFVIPLLLRMGISLPEAIVFSMIAQLVGQTRSSIAFSVANRLGLACIYCLYLSFPPPLTRFKRPIYGQERPSGERWPFFALRLSLP